MKCELEIAAGRKLSADRTHEKHRTEFGLQTGARLGLIQVVVSDPRQR